MKSNLKYLYNKLISEAIVDQQQNIIQNQQKAISIIDNMMNKQNLQNFVKNYLSKTQNITQQSSETLVSNALNQLLIQLKFELSK